MLYRVQRADALYEELCLAFLVGVVFDAVADVEGTLALDVAGLGALAKGDAIHHDA